MASIPDPPAPGAAQGSDEQRRDYEVGAPLREGWGGTLRDGRYRRTGLRVTVQDVRAELTMTPGLVERLAGIGRRAAAVRDPHLVAVYDLVQGHGVLQLIAGWTDAPTLAALLRRREVDPLEAVHVIDGVLAGLETLHAAGLFHGRVGAETVVVEPDGRARLAELAVCAAAAPPGAGPEADLRAAARLGLELLRGSGRRLEPVRRVLEPALDTTGASSAAGLRAAVASAVEGRRQGARNSPGPPARTAPALDRRHRGAGVAGRGRRCGGIRPARWHPAAVRPAPWRSGRTRPLRSRRPGADATRPSTSSAPAP